MAIKKTCYIILLSFTLALSLFTLSGCDSSQGPDTGQGLEIVVNNPEDSGEGSLRWALETAAAGDTITFDPEIFWPYDPATINIQSKLPALNQGKITIDASNAGVIINGAFAGENNINGLEIVSSHNNIMGLQIVNFQNGAGIALSAEAKENMIGGDRATGTGPCGEGNQLSANETGISLAGSSVTGNVITGNLIGTNENGQRPYRNISNLNGITISDGASANIIGADNIIAFNEAYGVHILGNRSESNTLTRNSIFSNGTMAIYLEGGNAELQSPLITEFNINSGTVAGSVCPGCTIEVFTANGREGQYFAGETQADEDGSFSFSGALAQAPRFTATVTDAGGNTSEFSAPTAVNEIVVYSTEDSGEGSLRQALQDAQPGDIITFNPEIFPPEAPATISLESELPIIRQGYLTLDASNAGVILDGSGITPPGEAWTHGLSISSNWNTIMGLQIINFSPASGILLADGAQNNRIGGDRNSGSSPLGQGNLVSHVDTGIAIQGLNTSYNLVTGNYIGAGPEGRVAPGNHLGIHVLDSARHNVIGPDNLIANNEMGGIMIDGNLCYGNTITRNLIYGNAGFHDIYLWGGANRSIDAPLLINYTEDTGNVSGATLPSALVEIYSIDESGVLHHEGVVTANIDGYFSYSKGNPLIGHLPILLATDTLGNSSALSKAKLIPSTLQAANQEPLQITYPKTSAELDDNKIGGHWHGLWIHHDLDVLLDQILSLGLKRYRFSINSMVVDSIEWDKSELSITPEHDAFIDALVENDLSLTYVLMFWDKEFFNAGGELGAPRFKNEGEFERYLDFTRTMVRLLGDRIDAYEVWNEATALVGTIEYVEINEYMELVRRAAAVIREERPEAKIVISGTDYLIMDHAQRFKNTYLQSDLMELVDVVAWHPMYGTSPVDSYQRGYYYNYPQIVRDMKAKAEASGFRGDYVADELTWRTPATAIPEVEWLHAFEEIIAAKYTLRGIMINLGLDVAVTQQYIDPPETIIINGVRNLCTTMEGHEAVSMPVEIQIDYDRPIAYCSFRYPNGDRMLALWTDGVAVEEAPGVPATITFPGLITDKVTGIDVLHGLEQDLVFTTDGETTIVKDILVKDYPILIRLNNPSMSSDYEESVGDGFHRLAK